VHHYPTPIAEIELIKRDDFDLWVRTPDGALAAVVPVAPRGSGDGRTRLLFAASPEPADQPTPIARLVGRGPAGAGAPLGATDRAPADPTILPADHPLSQLAFVRQNQG
jgi:hypothetical protein